MLTCGLKLTHDGAVALIENDRLVFSVEIEKLSNNSRYSRIDDLNIVQRIFEDWGYSIDDVDHFVVDGWSGATCSPVNLRSNDKETTIIVAPYHENTALKVFEPSYRGVMEISGSEREYSSYFHVSGHIASAYYTSPFAVRGEPAFVLVWDGGLFPRLYFVDPGANTVENGGPLFPVIGHFYATAGHHFGPWPRVTETEAVPDLSIAGKLMAYISLGKEREEVVEVLARLWDEIFAGRSERAISYRRKVGGWGSRIEPNAFYLGEYYRELRNELGDRYPDEDVLASMHSFVGSTLVRALSERVESWKGGVEWNLCFTGGCALNIKWNSALRKSELFRDVWVPPFPNDSGAAIGTALCHIIGSDNDGRFRSLDWHVRLGPEVAGAASVVIDGWSQEKCDAARLAEVLHIEQEPVVVLNGRAELGPRALGGRSVVAAPTDQKMKERLNEAKLRAHYRPVAPICLESEAEKIFEPGTPDPYMLFDHQVREEYLARIPAVVHLDGTARLQTVNEFADPFIAELLAEYAKLSEIPVLCNTSANLNGCGFFPDVRSAAEWGRVPLIWNNGYLYRKDGGTDGPSATNR
jgi:carbamoyltransferase